MASGASKYSILLKAAIQKITQAEINDQTKGLKINLDMNLVGAGQIVDKINQIKQKASGKIAAGVDFTDAANKMSTMSAEVDKIRASFAGLGENVSVSKIFDDTKIQKYSVSVDKVAEGIKTIDKYTVEIGENGEQVITNAKSVEKSIGDASLKQKRLNDLADGYKLTLDDVKVKHKDAFSIGSNEMTTAENKLLNLIDAFRQGKASTEDIRNAFTSLKTETEKVEQGFSTAREKTDNFSTALVKNIGKVVQWAIATGAIYGTLRDFKEGVQYVKDLNTELTNIGLVTGQSTSELAGMASEFNSLAKELGTSTLEVAKGGLEWIRQGRSMSDTMLLLKNSTMLAKLGNIDSADATSKLTATINAYNVSAKDSIGIVDTLVSLDNSLAASTEGIANGMQKASSMAKQAGVSYQNLASYVGVLISRTQQSGDTIGQALKTIFARMESVKAGATIDKEGEAINDVEKVLIANGIRLRDGLNTFRDMDTVLSEVAVKYKELGEAGNTVAQGQILTAIAGQRQINIVASLLDGWDDVVKAQETASSSAGIAKSRYEIFLDSVNASMNKFKASWEAVWQKTINSEFIKLFYDAGAEVGNFISTLGGLLPVITELAGILVATNNIKIAGFFTKAIEKAEAFKNTLLGVKTAAQLTKGELIGIGIALVGVLSQVISFVKEATDLNKKLEKSQEEISNITSDLSELEQKKDSIKSLSDEYSLLSKVVNKSSEQQKRFNEVQTELKKLLPGLKIEIDSVGDYKISEDSLQSNQSYNKLLQDRIDLKKEELSLGVKDEIELEAKAYEKNLSRINKLNEEIKTYNILNEKVLSPEGELTAEEMYDWSHFYIAMDIDEYQNELLELQDQNLGYVQKAAETFDTLPPLQQASLLKQLEDTENFQKEFLEIWMDIAEEAENTSIVPVEETAKDFQKLTEASDNASKSLSSTFNGVVDLIDALEDSNVVTMDQVQTLKDLFPVDATGKLRDYTDALSVQNGQVVVNTNVLRELTIERANAAVVAAQEAYTVANAAFMEADATVSAALAEVKAKAEIINSNINLSESEKKLALDAIESANARVIAELAVLEAKKNDAETAKKNLEIAKANLANMQSSTYWNNALAGSIDNVANSQNESNKALEAYNDLLEMTIKMLKQQKQEEIDALEEELDNYKKIIDAKKESLDLEKEEADYQKDLADKNKILSDIDNELLQLQFDNSEEGKKRRLELEEERAKAVEDINELEADRSIDIQKQALDDEYEAYKETLEAKIKDLEKYLDQEGLIRNEAIDLLQARTDEFYQSLIAWNRLYGSGVDSDVIDKWAIATNTMSDFAGASVNAAGTAAGAFGAVSEVADDVTAKIATLLAKLREMEDLKQGYSSSLSDYYYQLWQKSLHPDQYHDGGLVGAKSYHNGSYVGTLPKIKETEVFAKLLKGEVVSTESQMKNFINNTLPNLARGISENTNVGNINLSFNIAGSLDRSVLPDIKSMVSDALNNIIKSRGITRNATSFSV